MYMRHTINFTLIVVCGQKDAQGQPLGRVGYKLRYLIQRSYSVMFINKRKLCAISSDGVSGDI